MIRAFVSGGALGLVFFGLTFDHSADMAQGALRAAIVLALLAVAYRQEPKP